MPVRDNVVPLSDGAGEVVEVGSGVTRVKAGDKVAGCFFQRWSGGEPPPEVQAGALGGSIDGMLADYAVLEEEGVVKIPGHLSLDEGATLPCAGVTVWHAMMEHAKLAAGQTVLLQGTGGVSIFGLQIAHAMGAQVVVTSSSDENSRGRKNSAPAMASTTRPPRTGRRQQWSLPAAAASTTFAGGRRRRYACALVRRHPGRRQDQHDRRLERACDRLNPGLILARRANVQGISVGSTQMFEAMNCAIAANAIKPVIDKVFGFDEVQAAYKHMASGAHFGKIVIRVA